MFGDPKGIVAVTATGQPVLIGLEQLAKLTHPTWNQYNELPGPPLPNAGLWRWYHHEEGAFVLKDAAYVWLWKGPVFDLRPELRTGDEIQRNESVPINRAGALGSGVALRVLVRGQPAGTPFLSCAVWNEVGLIKPTNLCRVGPAEDVTDTLLAGGEDSAASFPAPAFSGGSLLTVEPPSSVPRFWRTWIQFTMKEGVLPPVLSLDASVE